MTMQAEGEQLPHDDAPAAPIDNRAALAPWFHKDGSHCPDWDSCDTYEHYTETALLEMLGVQRIPDPPDQRCAECPDHGLEAYCQKCRPDLWAKDEPSFNQQTPEPGHCVQCRHPYGDHAGPEGNGCQLTGCTCPRYYIPEGGIKSNPEQRDGNVGELIDGRVNVYGDPVSGFVRHAQVWSGILGHEVQPWQVALCMLGYKLVRTGITPDYSDNSDDIEGYLDIFRQLMPDMVQARDTAEYLAGGGIGARS